MRGMLEGELFLQAPTRLKEPIAAVLRDRAGLALALGLQRPSALTHPRPAALRTSDELLRIEIDRNLILVVLARLSGLLVLALQALLGLAQRLASALARAQMLRQLVAAVASVELILATVGRRRFLEDLAGDLTEVAVGVDRGVGRHL